MKYLKLTLTLLSCLLFACGGKNPSDGSQTSIFSKSKLETNYPDFQVSVLSDSLKSLLSDTTFTAISSIDSFYVANDYHPVWTKDIFENPALDTLVACIQQSSAHGLDPEIFDRETMSNLLDSLRNGAYGKEMPAVYHAMRQLEYLATKAFVDYTTGLNYGFVHPKTLFPDDYFIGIQSPDSAHRVYLFSQLKEDPLSYLQSVQPTNEHYLKLQGLLKEYETLQETTFDSIPFKKGQKNYTLNQENEIFPLIAKRLMITGELPQTEYADSIYATLTPELMEAVNLFRVNNSYPEDEELGEGTVQSLNRPFSYYHKAIQANLERARWKRITPASKKYAQVNVAAFILQAFEPDYDPIKMNVCVGIAYRNQTPLLESEIYYINLNPQWNVPSSIVEKEIYWLVKKDPTYLSRHRMKVLSRGGGEVDASSLNWDDLNPKRFPYLIRQESGNANSLGRIKFMFENPFSVYLHDTPSKRNFSYKNRAVSHGCVRIQKPMDFAFFCLTEKDSVYFDRLRISIDQSPISVEGIKQMKEGKLKRLENVVHLKEKVPLTIDYYTVYMLPDGKFYFADDVYGFDKKILGAMKLDQNTKKEISATVDKT